MKKLKMYFLFYNLLRESKKSITMPEKYIKGEKMEGTGPTEKDLIESFVNKMLSFEAETFKANMTLVEATQRFLGDVSRGHISIRMVERDRQALARSVIHAMGAAKDYASTMRRKGGERCLMISDAILNGDLLNAEFLAKETGNHDEFVYVLERFQTVDKLLHTKFFPVEAEALSYHLPCFSYTGEISGGNSIGGYGKYVQTREMDKIPVDEISFIISNLLNKVAAEIEEAGLVEKVLSFSSPAQAQGLFDKTEGEQPAEEYGLKR